jgi:hypothetical protein
MLADGEEDEDEADTAMLVERLMNDASLFEKLQQSAEDRAKEEAAAREEHLRQMQAFEAQYSAVFVDLSRPRFMLLNEDVAQLCAGSTQQIDLVYYVPGDTADHYIGTESDAWISLPFVNDQMARHMVKIRNVPTLEVSVGDEDHPSKSVWVNGRPLTESMALRNLDRIIVGPFAFRVLVPAIENEDDAEGFDQNPHSLGHLELLERYARLQVEAEEGVDATDIMNAVKDTVVQSMSGEYAMEAFADSANDLSRELLLAMSEDDALGLANVRYQLAEVEKELCRDYPMAPLVANGTFIANSTFVHGDDAEGAAMDYAAVINERNEHVATTAAIQRMADLKRQEAESDLEIQRLREELARRQSERDAQHEQAAALAATAAAEIPHQPQQQQHRDPHNGASPSEGDAGSSTGLQGTGCPVIAVAPGESNASANAEANGSTTVQGGNSLLSADGQQKDPKDRWKSVLRKVSAVQSLARPKMAISARHSAEEKLQLAQELQIYEESCRNTQAWQPNGPSDPSLAAEYNFSLQMSTLAEFLDHNPIVLYQGTIQKLRVKTGFFSRSGYHGVHLVVLPKTLAYFDKNMPTCPARAIVYYFGASIQVVGKVEGKYAVRIDPAVPRKPGKVGKENAVILSTDTAQAAEELVALLRQHSMPLPPPRVAEFLASEEALA